MDGHITDVSIYRVIPAAGMPGFEMELRYQSPEPGTYDTKWEVVGWNGKLARATLLRTAIRDYVHTSKRRYTVSLAKESKLP